MKSREKSLNIYHAACDVIPGGVNSPIRAYKGLGIPPMVVKKGQKDLIVDEDEQTYIDMCGSWGALILGHAHPDVVHAAQEQMALGSTFGITTAVEKEIAEHIVNRIPCIDKIRFVSSGTEATMSAARVARGFTHRKMIVKFDGHYHGHNDTFLIKAGSSATSLDARPSSLGVPEEFVKETVSLPFNDVEITEAFLEKHAHEIAAVILEPIAANMGVVKATQEFMLMLREVTSRIGALLIFDEVVTGFRVSEIGALALYPVEPDLVCYGKIIGGGFPAAAFGGRKEVMDVLAPLGGVFQAGTLSGNPVAMRAGLTTLEITQQKGFYEQLQRSSDIITLPVQEMIRKRDLPLCLQQEGSMFTLFFGVKEVMSQEDLKGCDMEQFHRFFIDMFEKGVYIPPSAYEAWFVSSVHEKMHLEKTRDLILDFLKDEF